MVFRQEAPRPKPAGVKRAFSFAPSAPKCTVCDKSVYLTEQIKADEKVYHKGCFRCSECSKMLSLGNYAVSNMAKLLLSHAHFVSSRRWKGKRIANLTSSSFSSNLVLSVQPFT